MRISEEEYNEFLKKRGIKEKEEPKKKKAKYNNKKVNIDGHCFDSKLEGDYYEYLKFLLRCKEIKGYALKPKFILGPKITYTPDFIIFENDNSTSIIDTKGIETDVFKIKKKLLEDMYKLKVEIIKKGDF